MFALVMKQDYGDYKAGEVHLITRSFNANRHNMDRLLCVRIPDQDVSHIYDKDHDILPGIMLSDLTRYTAEENEQIIDRETGAAINKAVHPLAGTNESIGTIRDMVVQIINAIGLAPTADFKRLNEIAIAAIEEGATEKGAIK